MSSLRSARRQFDLLSVGHAKVTWWLDEEVVILHLPLRGHCKISPERRTNIQYNFNGSNPDGSFTVDDSNSFFSPYKILQIAQENKYLVIFSDFFMELYVVCTH